MRVAHHLAAQVLPGYASKFSRHDFTLAQLFACLVVKEHQRKSYRQAEALLKDAEHWCRDIGMRKAPDHNTLCRAAKVLLKKWHVDKLLDVMARLAATARALGLSLKPLAVDSSYFEPRHVSRYFESRRGRGTGEKGQRRKARRLPKLAIGVAAHGHLILAAWTGIGLGGDHPHLAPVLRDARRRVRHRSLTAVLDAGYDSEASHRLAREELGVRSIIPPLIGRQTDKPPRGRWRRHMRRMLKDKRSRRRCGYTQRWQAETVNSMIKRNLGSALRGKTDGSRQRDLRLKVLTHNVMILLPSNPRVETEHS